MIDRLRALFGKITAGEAAQHQREAMIDLLIWTMYADGRLALPENDKIDSLAEELPWDSVTPFQQYLNTSIARVRSVLADEEKSDELLGDIYGRLRDDEMRTRAFRACRDLAQVDGEVDEAESVFLDTVRARFNLA